MDCTVIRTRFDPTGTFGTVHANDWSQMWHTAEQVRDHNRGSTKDTPGACIPAGTYICRRVDSPSHGDVFEVTGVPGRLYIQIHAANWPRQLRGCIALGKTFGEINDGNPETVDTGVGQSKTALAEFMAMQAGLDRFTLTIIDAIPETP